MDNLQTQIGFQEVWTLFKETDKRSKETDKQIKQTDKKLEKLFKQTNEQFKQTNEQFKQTNEQTNEQFKQTNEQFKQTDKKLEKLFRETNEQFKQTDKNIKEMSEQLKKTEKMVGNLGNRWGEFVEGMVKPGMLRIFKEQGIDIEQVYERCVSRKNNDTMEIDLLGVNGPCVVAVEVKSKLTIKGVRTFIKKLAEFKRFFPLYSDKKVTGAVAGITIFRDANDFAYDNGLYIIGQAGEGVTIINDQKFKPRFW